MRYELRIAGKFLKSLKAHLFPGDGKEAVAILLCGRHENAEQSILLSHQLFLVPYEDCERHVEYVRWKTNTIIPLLEKVEKSNFALLKIHSHPGNHPEFSDTDDISDVEFGRTAFDWSETNSVHGSAVMLPSGEIFGRVVDNKLQFTPFHKVSVAGNYIQIWRHGKAGVISLNDTDGFAERTMQVLGEKTYHQLKSLKIGVIGCSGTGSPTIEQLYRLGVGELVIIDPDVVEVKNLNRIIQSRMADAKKKKKKVVMMATAINKVGLGTKVIALAADLFASKKALLELIQCDIIFGCVDGAESRHLINQLTNFYLIPYFDMGVRIDADGSGGIEAISGTGHYIQPGLSTLLSRQLYTIKRLEAESLQRQDPEEFKKRLKAGYIHNVLVNRPAVLPVNMLISSMTVIDFLNRLHSHALKEDGPENYARMLMDFSANCTENKNEAAFEIDEAAAKYTGRGDCRPFLRISELDRL